MNALSIDEAALDVNNKTRKTGFDTKVKAQHAAVAAIGPHARNGFEFEVFKVDGRWQWRAFDVVKPPTPAEIKAMGGKRAFSRVADQARHEERGAERAAGEGRLRVEPPSSLVAMAQQISGGTPRPAPRKPRGASKAPEARVKAPVQKNAPVAPEWPEWTGGPNMTIAGESIPRNATIVGPIPGDTITGNTDGLDLPTFLKRPKLTAEEKAALHKKMERAVGPERTIKNPPSVEQAKAKAKKNGNDTKAAKMLTLAQKWTTEEAICKVIGWKSCLVTLRRACEKIGATLERRDNPDGGKSQYRIKP